MFGINVIPLGWPEGLLDPSLLCCYSQHALGLCKVQKNILLTRHKQGESAEAEKIDMEEKWANFGDTL